MSRELLRQPVGALVQTLSCEAVAWNDLPGPVLDVIEGQRLRNLHRRQGRREILLVRFERIMVGQDQIDRECKVACSFPDQREHLIAK